MILGYGILLPLLIIPLRKWHENDRNFFLTVWLVISLALAFLPLGFARFYLRTLFLPMILLIFLNLDRITKEVRLSKQVIIILLIFLVPLSTFYIFYKRLAEVTRQNPWYFISEEESQALDYLAGNSIKGSGVLADYHLGNYIPAYSNNQVYFGHLIQTPDSSEKLDNILRFYAQKYSDHQAQSFLIKENISYIVSGNKENLKYSFLKPVFQNNEVTIFSF